MALYRVFSYPDMDPTPDGEETGKWQHILLFNKENHGDGDGLKP